jgi:hypothetical protein
VVSIDAAKRHRAAKVRIEEEVEGVVEHKRELVTTRMDRVKMRNVEWVWPGRISWGGILIIWMYGRLEPHGFRPDDHFTTPPRFDHLERRTDGENESGVPTKILLELRFARLLKSHRTKASHSRKASIVPGEDDEKWTRQYRDSVVQLERVRIVRAGRFGVFCIVEDKEGEIFVPFAQIYEPRVT